MVQYHQHFKIIISQLYIVKNAFPKIISCLLGFHFIVEKPVSEVKGHDIGNLGSELNFVVRTIFQGPLFVHVCNT